MRSVIALILVLGWSSVAFANNVDVKLSPDVIEVGEIFQYETSVSTNGQQSIDITARPEFGDLMVVGSKRVPQIAVVNGRVTQNLRLIYRLRAEKPGSYAIKSPTFRVDGKTSEPKTVTMRVVPKGKLPTKKRSKVSKSGSNVLEASMTPKENIYVGQQVTLEYNLYMELRTGGGTPRPPDEPSLDDFWIEDLGDKGTGRRTTVSRGGRLYYKIPLRKYALFPLRAGKANIESMGVTVMPEGFFFRRAEERVESDAIELEILPLPPDAPEGFYEGNVGQWRITTRSDTSQTRVGSPVTIDIRVNGNGQVGRIQLPKLPEIDGLRIGEPAETSQTKVANGLVQGQKTLSYTITPLKEGNFAIPPVTFAYFDPSTQTYKSSASQPITLKVAAGELPPEPIKKSELTKRATSSTEDLIEGLVKQLPEPRPLIIGAVPIVLVDATWFWAIILALLLAIIALFAEPPFRRHMAKSAPERERRALAESILSDLSTATDADTVAANIRRYLKEVVGLKPGQVNAAGIPKALKEFGVDPEDAKELAALLKSSDDARFAPTSESKTVESGKAAKILRLINLPAITLVAMLAVGIAFASPESALKSYKSGDFAQAANEYEVIAEDHPHLADAWLNAAVSHARAGNFPAARLAVERASLRAPQDTEIDEANEKIVRMIRLKTIKASRSSMSIEGNEALFWWRVASQIPANALPIATFVLLLFLLAGLVLRRTGKLPEGTDRVVVWSCLTLAVLAGGLLWGQQRVLSNVTPIVITSDSPDYREGPSKHSAEMRAPKGVQPGVMLRRLEVRDEWTKIAVHDDHVWVATSDVAVVD